MLQDCVGTFVDAGSSDSLERIATHLRSSGIWCGRDSIVHGLVDPDHLPRSGRDPIRAIHRLAGDIGCGLRLGLGQAVARSRPSLRGQKRRCSGRGHRHAGVAVIRTPIFNPLCLDPTGNGALEHPWPCIPCARWRLPRGMVACRADRGGGRLGIKPLGFQRCRRSGSVVAIASKAAALMAMRIIRG